MFAIVAAIIFGLGLILDLAKVNLGGTISLTTFILAGLLFLALQHAGLGAYRGRWNNRRR